MFVEDIKDKAIYIFEESIFKELGKNYIEQLNKGKKNVIFFKDSLDAKNIKSLYNMYEFSDFIVLVSKDNSTYPTIFNYVNTGLLTMDEAVEALLQ